MDEFLEMLSFTRPAWTPYEDAFITRYLMPFKPKQDGFGNLIVNVGKKPNIVWSSHTDTVHTKSGLQEIKTVRFRDKDTQLITRREAQRADKKGGGCLGADCTTGVWIMMEMIRAGVKGRYIFHRDEEAGGHGSKYIAEKTPDLLKGIDAAVAFDRKGYYDVITRQRGDDTASREFAQSFADILGLDYKPSPNGMFTDTANYMAIVPECTNISVGYFNAHTANEVQDLTHLQLLRNKMIEFDTSSLVIKRTPKAATPPYVYSGAYGGSSWSQGYEDKTVYDLIRSYPKSIERFLLDQGVTFEELKASIAAIQTNQRQHRNSELPALISGKH